MSNQRQSHLENQVAADANNLGDPKTRSRVNSLLSSDANQLNGIKIMNNGPGVLQTQKVTLSA